MSSGMPDYSGTSVPRLPLHLGPRVQSNRQAPRVQLATKSAPVAKQQHPSPGDRGTQQTGSARFKDACQKAAIYADRVEAHFHSQPDSFRQFLELLRRHESTDDAVQDVWREMSNLLSGSAELLSEFSKFLPEALCCSINSQLGELRADNIGAWVSEAAPAFPVCVIFVATTDDDGPVTCTSGFGDLVALMRGCIAFAVLDVNMQADVGHEMLDWLAPPSLPMWRVYHKGVCCAESSGWPTSSELQNLLDKSDERYGWKRFTDASGQQPALHASKSEAQQIDRQRAHAAAQEIARMLVPGSSRSTAELLGQVEGVSPWQTKAITVVETLCAAAEVDYVITTIAQLCAPPAGGGQAAVSLSDIAILCRRNRSRSYVKQQLLAHGIPVSRGGCSDKQHDAVKLLQIRRAEGHRWRFVFVVGMMDGQMPLCACDPAAIPAVPTTAIMDKTSSLV
jgi:hypothetical protein